MGLENMLPRVKLLTGGLAELKEIHLAFAADPDMACLPLERLATITRLLEDNMSLMLQILTEWCRLFETCVELQQLLGVYWPALRNNARQQEC